jgi:hypothetical protein
MDLRLDFARQLEHWKGAIARLADPDAIASPQAWRSLEHYLGVALRQTLATVVARLRAQATEFEIYLRAAPLSTPVAELQSRMVQLRHAYLRAETTVEFYADVLASRSVPRLAALLRSCDHIATRSMAEALTPMGRQVPAALTYLDAGIGASVLKFGLRLHDGSAANPVATIKVTRHNLLRPTSLIHEAGHQVAHTLGWNEEAHALLHERLGGGELATIWAGWTSEITADAFAHAHTGYAATAALHDVLDDSDEVVFRMIEADPHPFGYIRLLLAIEMCRDYGSGPWDSLAAAWQQKHPIEAAGAEVRALVRQSLPLLPAIVQVLLHTPCRAFGGRPLSGLIDPRRVSPESLARLERDAGEAAFTSPYWAWNEAVRLLALTGFRAGVRAGDFGRAVAGQESWMVRLGASHAIH